MAFALSAPCLYGVVSEDGRFSADATTVPVSPPHSGVWLTDLTTGVRTAIPAGPGQALNFPYELAISPDGSQVAFTAEGFPEFGFRGIQLYLYDAATGTTDYLYENVGRFIVGIQGQSDDGDLLFIVADYFLDDEEKFAQYRFSTRTINYSPDVRINELLVVPTDPGRPYATVDPSLIDFASSDPNGDPLTLRLDPPGPYPIGTTLVRLVVSDGTFTVTSRRQARIVVEDREAPRIDFRLRLPVLLPFAHALVDVGLRTTASDNSGAVTLECSVTQDEPVIGTGPGDLAPDAVCLTAPDGTITALLLRAERAAGGDGRVYQVLITARDAAGNSTSASHAVVVPRDLRLRSLLSAAAQWLRAELDGEPLPYDSMMPAGGG
jgi:hypothetical protein